MNENSLPESTDLLIPKKMARFDVGDFSTNSTSERYITSFKTNGIFDSLNSDELKKKGVSHKGIIGTHNGTFHCDDVTACVMLKLLPQFSEHAIVRTRNENLLNDFDVVVDVGAVYDANKNRFDHHQRSFHETMNSLNADYPWTVKLSSAGLVYFHFGRQLISTLLDLPENSKEVRHVYFKLYENFIQEIDALDNGIDQFPGTPSYQICTGLSSRVKNLNPAWNSKLGDDAFERRFEMACSMVHNEFLDRVFYYADSWLPARKLVYEAIQNRFQVHESGELIAFEKTFCPWSDHLLSIEEELNIQGVIKFVLYTDPKGMWRVQAVPVKLHSFDNRVSLKQEWRGLRNNQLEKVSDIPGSIFVHISGFTGGNQSREGAILMALKSLDAVKKDAI